MNIVIATAASIPNNNKKNILALDIPGLTSSVRSRGGSNVDAFGMMVFLACASSC